jgi:hypothetical protein
MCTLSNRKNGDLNNMYRINFLNIFCWFQWHLLFTYTQKGGFDIARICNRLKSREIDSEESILPDNVGWRTGPYDK